MTKLPIITIPDPLLKTTSKPVERVDDELRKLLDDMLETMYEAPGIGLAAIQVAVPRRVIVIDIAKDEQPKNPIYIINPEILEVSDELRLHEEGCLSIPEIYAEIERPAKVRVRYIDSEGQSQELEAEGLLATVIQHEIDHLNGVLFIDHLSKLKRDRLVKKFIKGIRNAESV